MTLPEDVAEALERMCTPLHPSRLGGATAQADADCMEAIRAHLLSQDAELRENDELRERMGRLLTDTANVLKGKPAGLSLHSWHDLPEVARALQSRLAAADAFLRDVADCAWFAKEAPATVELIHAHLAAGDVAAAMQPLPDPEPMPEDVDIDVQVTRRADAK